MEISLNNEKRNGDVASYWGAEKRNGDVASYWGARQFRPMAGHPNSEL